MNEESIEFRGERRTHTEKSISRKVVLLFFLICLGALGYSVIKKPRDNAAVSPVPSQKESIFSGISLFKKTKNPEVLKENLTKIIGNTLKNYSVYVKRLDGSFSLDMGKSVVFTGASVNKLFIFAALYALADKKTIDLDTQITMQAEDIQDYGTGSMRYDPVGTVYSVKTLGRLMIQQSDNTAAYILGRQILSFDTIQQKLNDWGFTQTNMEENTTSNADTQKILELIYTGKVTNKALTEEMLSILKGNEINDRIPKQLPPGTVVYHKTGNAVGILHDVGIVEHPNGTYYIGILTSDATDEEKTAGTMAAISKAVYDFMQ